MTTPIDNILVQVQEYAPSYLTYLDNQTLYIRESNKRFENFNTKFSANLGDTIKFDLQIRANVTRSLVAADQPIVQRFSTITAGNAYNSAFIVSDPQRIFNFAKSESTSEQIEYYMENFTKPQGEAISSAIEEDMSKNIIGARTYQDSNRIIRTDKESGAFRFFGNGTTQINSAQQLAQMNANFRAWGNVFGKVNCYLPMTKIPLFVDNFLNQFVPTRNEEMAKKWMLGTYQNVDYFDTNIIPRHDSGTVGSLAQTLTVLSVITNPQNQITGVVASGASVSDPNAIKANDMVEFNLSSNANLNTTFGTFVSGLDTGLKVQNRVAEDAGSDSSGNVTITFIRPFTVGSALDDSINIVKPIVPNMTLSVPPSHFAGSLHTKDAFLLAMPRLPETTPYPSAVVQDSQSGASLRMYYGFLGTGEPAQRVVLDCITGSALIAERSMRIILPLN
ncbi:MAG: hypothetical protein E6R13_00655 [Spirochaetes bacterium]|nr:MAG: hypothetical protein E6R13_00655 [Spirochaetota bacterium]